MQENKNQILIHIKEIEEKICEETKILDEYRSNRNKHQQNIQHIQALKSRIHIAADKIKQMETARTSIEDIKAACTKEIKVFFLTAHFLKICIQQNLHLYLINYLQAIIKKQLQMYKEYNTVLKDCFNCNTNNVEIKFAITLLQQTLMTKENDAEELKDKFAKAEKVFKHHDEEFQPLKREAERLYNEALTTTNNINPQDNAFKPLNKAFEKLPATIAEINNELNIAQAKVFCMARNVDTENVSMAMGNIITFQL